MMTAAPTPLSNRKAHAIAVQAPDILIVMADQMTPSALPFPGNPVTYAPNMARLADGGVVFDAAYAPSPLCSPARASFMTGLLPSHTGTYDNAAEFASDIPTFAHYLRRAGYRTVLSGKMHFCGADQLHGFEERLTTDIYPADYGWTPDWDRPHERPSWYHDMYSVLDAGPCLRSNRLDFDDEVSFTAQRALFDHVRSGDGRPLCLVVSFTHPHDPFAISPPYWDLYRDVEIPLPAVAFGDAPPQPHELRLREVCAMEGVNITLEHVRAARRAYYGSISYLDEQVGRLLDILKAGERFDSTVVVLTSDHGEMLGERGAWYKMSFFEGSARVPLVVHAPTLFEPRRVSSPVSTMDLVPTLVDLTRGAEPSPLVGPVDGASLVERLRGTAGPEELRTTEVAGEYLAEGAIAPIVMLRRGQWKFVHSPADPDQLYDLSGDPAELVNLAGDQAFSTLLASFRAQVAARWDLADLDAAVRTSQRRRRAVDSALSLGRRTEWDFTPSYGASDRYIRSHMDLNDLEARARFPAVARAANETGS
jgi:choline-sulfatase